MPLTQQARESHYGRMVVNIVQETNTPDEVTDLDALMRLLSPKMRLYVDHGTLGTRADRQEAMKELHNRAFQVVDGANPDTDAAAAHRATNHYHAEEPLE